MAFVFKPVVIRRVNEQKKRRRSRYYWAQYRDEHGNDVRRALKLPNGSGITDKAVAQSQHDSSVAIW